MRLHVAVSSSVGARANNEDNFFAAGRTNEAGRDVSFAVQCDRLPAVFAVCDGMGGLERGEVASRLAVEELRKSVAAPAEKESDLERVVQRMHGAVCREAAKSKAPLGAAAVVARVTRDETLEICNVGDCRAFLFQTGELTQISLDHTTQQELKEIGILSTDSGHLTQHLGMEEDEYFLEPYTAYSRLLPGTKLLLCSDGVAQRWSLSEIAEILGKSADAGEAANCLTKETGPGQDNATAIVVVRVDRSETEARVRGAL